MIMLFTRIFLIAFFLCCGNTHATAEEVAYLMTTSVNQKPNDVILSYSSKGYITKIQGNTFSTLEKTENITTIRFEDLTVTIITRGDYWHTDYGVQKLYPTITSTGDIGFNKVSYEGLLNGNRLYQEEVWLNGLLSHMVKSLLDEKGRFIWSAIVVEKDEVILLVRK